MRWNLKEAVSKSLVRRTEITYKARLREISWLETTKSDNYHFCSSRVKYDVDTKNTLRDGNPVYVRESALKKYLDSAYGITMLNYKAIHKYNPGMTEIVNYGSVILIKQEIDEAVKNYMSHQS